MPKGSVLGPILYLLCTALLAEIIQSHELDYYFYADDTQLYISFKDFDVDVARLRVLIICVKMAWSERLDCRVSIR